MDSGAAHGGAPNYSNMLAGYHQQQSDPNQHMMELLGLLRAVSCHDLNLSTFSHYARQIVRHEV